MYRERPSSLGGGAVLWSRTAASAPATARVLPDGCMDLIWHDGLLVAGPDTRAQLSTEQPGDAWTGLRFAPGTGPAVLGVPAHELRDRRVPLDALWPPARVRRLAEYVAGAADRGAALETVAARTAGAGPGAADPLYRAVAAGLAAGRGVAEVARAAGLSERQLHRRSLRAFGYGPKTLARVLRLQRALALARGGLPLAAVAAGAGYADQAHLARDVRALAGVPLTTLLAPR
ncbi:helix-turn-helix domain-containing protein [Streptomyces sp. TRM 70351]|uniref:helix-turn-helix domain-containing protein n=1 Tax=Streptomyces sp. TRM 70351 TaxID=3116552 RepID=UPI002E7BBE00|nr:helix-turn-helix domain-containing protein [Streptomyces sp. TRM 70351]MEE1928461.1 helix-turn-helix domain-containing protein [Streptomyces sp. TRM 70351]